MSIHCSAMYDNGSWLEKCSVALRVRVGSQDKVDEYSDML